MSKVKCAAGLDSLNVREMANVPEIDIKLKEVKNCTSLEQSKELLSLGLSAETSDMMWG